MYYFIVNTASRTGKAAEIWKNIKAMLDDKKVKYEYYITQNVGHATSLASDICDKAGDITLVVIGGDGTANEVINGMHDFDRVKFAYVPTGSGNDLGRGLGIDSKDPVARVEHILDGGEVKPMDLGKISTNEGVERLFAISAGIGVDAAVCKQALTSKLKTFLNKFGVGSATYVLLTVKNLFTMPVCDGELTLDSGEVKRVSNIIFCAAMNHPWEGGGVPMAPNASAYDGELSVCCVSDIKRANCFSKLPLLVASKHEGIKGFDIFNCKSIKLELKDKMTAHADGEYCGEPIVVEYSCVPSKLNVII